jgi:hypothetical protein
MHALELGDEVAVRKPDGSIGYEAVYAFGHRDKHTPAVFVELTITHGVNGTDGVLALHVSVTSRV